MIAGIPYEWVLAVHVSAFIYNIAIVVTADVMAGLWVFGKKPLLSLRTLMLLHYSLYAGLVLAITSGVLLFSQSASYLLTVPAFYAKTVFIVALVANSFFIGKHIQVASQKTFTELTPQERTPLLISGAISTISWVGAFIAAQSLGL